MILSKTINLLLLNVSENEDCKYNLKNINTNIDKRRLKVGDIFFGTISTTVKQNGKKKRLNNLEGLYMITDVYNRITVIDPFKNTYKTSTSTIVIKNNSEPLRNRIENDYIPKLKEQFNVLEQEKFKKELSEKAFNFDDLTAEDKLSRLVEANIKNIWMVGPAGCGKSTLARQVADKLDMPYLCISCGIGTSSTEFIGYKYPERQGTKFAEYYGKPSIILIDEMTALDPSVAQILNAALANDEIETTTGLVRRHPNCIIIATSNTFGSGADRQYVANNQLDASTIDRFVGGILEVSYSEAYESQYDCEVVLYVQLLRNVIKTNDLRRIASTRLIQAGHKLKFLCMTDWRLQLIKNWSDTEKELVSRELLKSMNTKKLAKAA